MSVKVFSLDEANLLIPFVESSIRWLQEAVRGIVQLQDSIAVLDVLGASDPKSPEHADLRRRRGELEAAVQEYSAKLEEVQESGCVLKDINTGIVDFYGLKDERLIFLCWRMGEKTIRFWHEVDAGMVGRRPVAEL